MSQVARKLPPPPMEQVMGSPHVVRSVPGTDQVGIFAGTLMIAGPWPGGREGWVAATQHLIDEEYRRLGPGRQALFNECLQRAGGPNADLDQMHAIVVMLSKGWDRERILRYAQPQTQVRPRKREPERKQWYGD